MYGKVVVFPGTFDPMTFGHVDIVSRAVKIFNKVFIAVAADTTKDVLFSLERRIDIINDSLKDVSDSVVILPFSGLLVNFMHSHEINVIIRGVRSVSDFNYEFKMSFINRIISEDIEVFFIPTSASYQFISSSFVKEISLLGGDVSKFVTPKTNKILQEIFISKSKNKK